MIHLKNQCSISSLSMIIFGLMCSFIAFDLWGERNFNTFERRVMQLSESRHYKNMMFEPFMPTVPRTEKAVSPQHGDHSDKSEKNPADSRKKLSKNESLDEDMPVAMFIEVISEGSEVLEGSGL